MSTALNERTAAPSGCWRAGERNYPRNLWWVAATADEVGDELISRWLLDRRVVLYRLADGTVNALEDRCPHRWAPLSEGKRDGDVLVCGYHGFRYDPDGTCVETPSQPDVKPRFCARRYPVQEHEGFVWIWMGDEAKADPALLPAIPSFTDKSQIVLGGYMPTACNFMLLQENVLDLTHFEYLHPGIQSSGWRAPKPKITVKDRTVKFETRVEDLPLPLSQSIPMGLEPGTRADRVDGGTFYSPACHVGFSHVAVRGQSDGGKTFTHYVMHCTTPISMTESHYWWARTMNYGHHVPGIRDTLRDLATRTFTEDKVMLEAIQQTLDRDSRGPYMPECSVKMDFGALQARKVLIDMMREENGN